MGGRSRLVPAQTDTSQTQCPWRVSTLGLRLPLDDTCLPPRNAVPIRSGGQSPSVHGITQVLSRGSTTPGKPAACIGPTTAVPGDLLECGTPSRRPTLTKPCRSTPHRSFTPRRTPLLRVTAPPATQQHQRRNSSAEHTSERECCAAVYQRTSKYAAAVNTRR